MRRSSVAQREPQRRQTRTRRVAEPDFVWVVLTTLVSPPQFLERHRSPASSDDFGIGLLPLESVTQLHVYRVVLSDDQSLARITRGAGASNLANRFTAQTKLTVGLLSK